MHMPLVLRLRLHVPDAARHFATENLTVGHATISSPMARCAPTRINALSMACARAGRAFRTIIPPGWPQVAFPPQRPQALPRPKLSPPSGAAQELGRPSRRTPEPSLFRRPIRKLRRSRTLIDRVTAEAMHSPL